jgi:hypothetical protein
MEAIRIFDEGTGLSRSDRNGRSQVLPVPVQSLNSDDLCSQTPVHIFPEVLLRLSRSFEYIYMKSVFVPVSCLKQRVQCTCVVSFIISTKVE